MEYAKILQQSAGKSDYRESPLKTVMKVNELKKTINKDGRANIIRKEPYANRISTYLSNEELKRKMNDGARQYLSGVRQYYNDIALGALTNHPSDQDIYLKEARKQVQQMKLLNNPSQVEYLKKVDPLGLFYLEKSFEDQNQKVRQAMNDPTGDNLRKLLRGLPLNTTDSSESTSTTDSVFPGGLAGLRDDLSQVELTQNARDALGRFVRRMPSSVSDLRGDQPSGPLLDADDARRLLQRDQPTGTLLDADDARRLLQRDQPEPERDLIDLRDDQPEPERDLIDLQDYQPEPERDLIDLREIPIVEQHMDEVRQMDPSLDEVNARRQAEMNVLEARRVAQQMEEQSNQTRNVTEQDKINALRQAMINVLEARRAQQLSKSIIDNVRRELSAKEEVSKSDIDKALREAELTTKAQKLSKSAIDNALRELMAEQEVRKNDIVPVRPYRQTVKTVKTGKVPVTSEYTEKEKEYLREEYEQLSRRADMEGAGKEYEDILGDVIEDTIKKLKAAQATAAPAAAQEMDKKQWDKKQWQDFGRTKGVTGIKKSMSKSGVERLAKEQGIKLYEPIEKEFSTFDKPIVRSKKEWQELGRKAGVTGIDGRMGEGAVKNLAKKQGKVLDEGEGFAPKGSGFRPLSSYPPHIIAGALHYVSHKNRKLNRNEYNREQARKLTQKAIHGEGFFGDLADKITSWAFRNLHPAGRMMSYIQEKNKK